MKDLFTALAGVTGLLFVFLPDAQAADEVTQFTPVVYDSKNADALWAQIEKLQQGPSERPKSQNDATRIMVKFLADLRSALEIFVARHPEDNRRWKAEVMLANVRMAEAINRGSKPNYAELREELQVIVESQNAPPDTRGIAQLSLITLGLKEAQTDSSPEVAFASIQAIENFTNDNPDHEAVIPLKLEQAKLLTKYDPARAREILKELSKNRQPNISQMANSILTQMDVMGKPLNLEFNSVSGEQFRLPICGERSYFWTSGPPGAGLAFKRCPI